MSDFGYCPKCGGADKSFRYVSSIGSDRIELTCQRCAYRWSRPPLEAALESRGAGAVCPGCGVGNGEVHQGYCPSPGARVAPPCLHCGEQMTLNFRGTRFECVGCTGAPTSPTPPLPSEPAAYKWRNLAYQFSYKLDHHWLSDGEQSKLASEFARIDAEGHMRGVNDGYKRGYDIARCEWSERYSAGYVRGRADAAYDIAALRRGES